MPARVTDDCPQMTQMNRAAAGCPVCSHTATINGFSARVAIVLTYVAPRRCNLSVLWRPDESQVQVVKPDDTDGRHGRAGHEKEKDSNSKTVRIRINIEPSSQQQRKRATHPPSQVDAL